MDEPEELITRHALHLRMLEALERREDNVEEAYFKEWELYLAKKS